MMADQEFDSIPLLQIDMLGESIWGSYYKRPSMEVAEREMAEFWGQASSCSERDRPLLCSEPDPTGLDNDFDVLFDQLSELEYERDRPPYRSKPNHSSSSREPYCALTCSKPDLTCQNDEFNTRFGELSELECNLLASNQLNHMESVLDTHIAKWKRFAPTHNAQEMVAYLR